MTNSIQLNHIGTVSLSGAEISDFDPKSQRLFVTGVSEDKPVIQVIDASDPTNPTKVTDIDLSSLGSGVQSVAVRKGVGTANSIIAVAISANMSTDPGKVVFYDAVTLTKLSEVTVGALPDMITFTPDGSKLLVANEGEPNEDYTVDPEGSVSIIDVSGDIASLDNSKVTTADFTAFNGQEATVKADGVRIFGLNASVAQDLEPEYIAVSPDNQTAFITLQENNAVAVLDIASGTINDIVPLGFKDHSLPGNGLDASDRDNGINIQNWPVFGMYQPDGISSFQVGGATYYITANEGDSRVRPTGDDILPAPNNGEGDIFNEETRVKDVILDPTAFPNAAELQADENLGRLTITKTLGDTDGDGDFDQLYAYGGRSFSIWNDQGQLVFDSGDQIEQILAQATPTLFNANNASPDDVDTRSDNKGPEPESAVVGVIDDVPYGFIGLERAGGGVMVYNLSDPTAPEFIQYIRTEGDVSPEGLKFISAEDSPNAKPLLAVSNEVSNTVSFYEIAPQPKLTTYEFEDLPKLGTTTTGQDIFLGGFSGLYFQGVAANGNLQFVTNTDRGPNGEPTGQNRPFLLPDFQPEIVSFELNQTTGEITITKRTGLFREDGTTPLTGLPNVQAGEGGTAYTDEIGVDLNGQVLPNDTLGADLEGIVIAENGDYWLVDEYRPAIYHFDVNGKLLDRFIPEGTAAATDPDQPAGTFGTEVLPAVYAQRRANRGFEAVALEGNKLYAFIQTPIDNPDSSGDTTSRNSRNLRILEFDIVSQQVTGEYLYLLDDITGSGNAKTDKIGDAVSLGNGKFAVVERDDRSDETSNKLIYQIDLAGATNINNSANFTLPADKTIEQLTEAELTTANITPVSKSLIVNAAQIGYTGVEKLEGLALVSPNTLAVINDNDFNVAGTTTPEKLGIIELPNNILLTLGTAGNDELYAQQGEEIQGLEGNDRLFAEGILGENILDGGDDDDQLYVVEGVKNTLKGGAGDDQLYVVEGENNTLDGDDGNDQLFVIEGSNNTLRGGAGDDLLNTSSTTGSNTLEGGDGDDILIGTLASDSLFGDAGNDSLFAGKQGTQMTGGAGLDLFYLGNGSVPDVPGEVLDFTKGDDKVVIAGIPEVQDFADLILEQVGADTSIKANINGSPKELGILRNVQANTLTADDFGFIVPVFSITDASAVEGNAITFTITRTDDILAAQTVTVSTSIATGNTASAADFTAKTETLSFAQGETQKTFAVQTTEDVLFEGDETFTVTLSNATNGSVISSATATGTITNNDPAPVFSIAAAEGLEGDVISFTVTRTGDAQADQSVTVATSIATDDTASAADFTANTQTLTFAAGETEKTFAVQTTEDVLFEGDETFTVTLSNATNGAIIDDTQDTVQGTINNDDPIPVFAIAAASALEGSDVTFTVTRTGDALGDQSVTVATSIATGDTASAADFTANTQTLTFAAGETEKTFTVATIQDDIVEDNETFTVTLSNATDGAVISSTNSTAQGTITDDDTPAEFSITSAEGLEGSDVTFTVTRSRDNLTPQSVTVATSISTGDTASAADFTANTQTLTFAVGETEKTFTVATIQDAIVEEDETFTVTLSNATDGAVISSTNSTAQGTITDDDISLAVVNNNNIFTIKGIDDTVRLKVTLIERNSNFISELGVFTVDDAEGKIDGIAPGEQGYEQAALDRVKDQGKAIFSAISNIPNGFNTIDLARLLGFDSGDHLNFFLVKDGTIDSFRAGLTPSTNVLFAETSTQQITSNADGFTIAWEEGSNVADFKDLVVKIESTNEPLTLGTALQGINQSELIDLTGISGLVKADFSVYREAAFNNEVYFYKVDNAQGQIGSLQVNTANQANYLQAAINNLIKDADTGETIKFAVANQGLFTNSAMIAGGSILAPLIIINGTLSQLTDTNVDNNPQVYFPYLGVNSDGVDHIRLLGDNTFGFEDLPNGGDFDYNDLIIKSDFSIV
ncbi:choice-of-anchor I family protein [Anabaena sp. PCC 7108]|uniref:choice-of-anchor I family protein n=1 Tax=Anabaena sp. PCC 7108 TaxID=163908 RepID=UPI0005AB6AFE|nr:choice-of-anchor I family protein [Anabaena sp. PCC 7108]